MSARCRALLPVLLLLGACAHAPERPANPQLVRLTEISTHFPEDVLAEAAGQTAVTRCVITQSGSVERCRVLQGLSPSAAASLAQHLELQRYEPPRYRGEPVDVDYTFYIELKPRAPKPPAERTPAEVVEADPTLVLPPDIVEAAAGQTLSLRCLITAEGAAKDCRTLEGPPAAAAAAARFLEARRFQPMTLGDSPVSMERTFTFRFKPQE